DFRLGTVHSGWRGRCARQPRARLAAGGQRPRVCGGAESRQAGPPVVAGRARRVCRVGGGGRRVVNEDISVTRKTIAAAERVVVKVGSSSLTTAEGGLDYERLSGVVDSVAARIVSGGQVVLVSSGAIAAGLAPLGLQGRPKDLATK